uniref:Uncharacterized protein n=1 Tax=Glossina morsitans morsitans TaxID=37546 RepID=A0A1B0FFG8_GLOMM
TLVDVKLTDAAQTDPGGDFTLDKLGSKPSSPIETKKSPEKDQPEKLIGLETTDALPPKYAEVLQGKSAKALDKLDSKLPPPVEPKKSPEKEHPDTLIDVKLTDVGQTDPRDDFTLDKHDSKLPSPVEPKKSPEKDYPDRLIDVKLTDAAQTDARNDFTLDKLDSKLSSSVELEKSPEKEHPDTLVDVKLTDAAQTDPGDDFTLDKLGSKPSSPIETKKSPEKDQPEKLIGLETTDALPPKYAEVVQGKPPKAFEKLDAKRSPPVETKKSPEKEHPDMLIDVKIADALPPDHADILKPTSIDTLDSKLSSAVGLEKSPEKEHTDKLSDVKLAGGLPSDHADVLKPKAFAKLYIKLFSPIKPNKSSDKEHPDKLLNLELIEALQTDHASVFEPTSTKPLRKLDSKAPLPAEFVKIAGKDKPDKVLDPNVMNVLPTDYSDRLKTKPINNLESRLSSTVELEESIKKECLRDHLPIEVEDILLPELNKSKDHSRSKSKPHIGKNIDEIILKDSGAIAYFVGLEQTVDRKERSKRPQTLSPQIESKCSEIILGADKKPTNFKKTISNKTSRKLPFKRMQDSSKTTAVEKPPTVSEVENKKPSRKTIPKQDEPNATKLVALNNQIRLERTSRTKTQPTTKSVKTDSTFTRTKPRPRTEITSLPQNQTLRTFSPPSTHPKPDYSGVTSIYAPLRKSQKKSASIKSKESTTVSRSSTPNEESQSKRTRTPTPSRMYNYMRPTMAHNLRYGVSKTSEDEISVDEKPPRSPVPTKRSDLEKSALKRKNLTKLRSNISGSKTSLSKSLHQVQDKDIATLKTLEVKPKKKAFGPAKSVSEKRSQVEHLKEHKLQKTEQSTYDLSIGRATETSLTQAQKRDKVQEIKKFESKSKSQDKYSATKKFIDKDKLSDDLKVQKKLKNTINQSNATSSTSSSVRKSKSKTTARSAASKKIEKEIANQKLTEKKPLTTTTTRISTIKLYREPVLTTLVSTVIIDDGDSENTTRSTRSNDSTKSSSSTGSKKIITSEVFTKTFGPDKPFEVIYRQPEVDYMSMMRPQSVEQRCVNEFDVSFIDTTDSSLSDSVALPIFGSDQDRLHAASPGSPKPTRSPLALIEETVRKQQMDGFALDPTLQRQFEAVGMISAIESPTSELILKPQGKQLLVLVCIAQPLAI